jgi:hypothetical protein
MTSKISNKINKIKEAMNATAIRSHHVEIEEFACGASFFEEARA